MALFDYNVYIMLHFPLSDINMLYHGPHSPSPKEKEHKQHPTCSVFCPGFQKGRVPSQKGTFSAMNGLSKGHFSAVNGLKRAL